MMNKMSEMILKLITRTAFTNAKKEANSACMCLGYQPKMPEKVRELKKK